MTIFDRKTTLFFLSTLILCLNFSGHLLTTLPLKKFIDGEFLSERFAFSRLVYNLEHGTEDKGGFLLRYHHADALHKSVERDDYIDFKQQLVNEASPVEIYASHYGLQDNLVFPIWQGLEWAKGKILEKARPNSRWHKRLQTLDLYYYNLITQTLVALVNALVLSAFILWVARQFSTRHGWIMLGLMLVTLPVLTFYGRSIWWMMWSWFVPMIVVLWGLAAAKTATPSWLATFVIGGATGAAICVKALMGYEYLPPVMVAAMVPIAYYAARHSWGWLSWFRVSAIIGSFALAGALTAFYLHWQALESLGADPFKFLKGTFQARAYGGEMVTKHVMIESTSAPFLSVLGGYLISPKELAIPQIIMMAPFLIWLWRYVRGAKGRCSAQEQSIANAFIAALGVAFLAGVSMLAIFKGHAYIHGYDIVIWCIPMNLFLLAFYSWRIMRPAAP